MTQPDKLQFREAMSRLGAAVTVITTDGAAGRMGFAATAVCSVTDSPATLLVCLNHSASVYDTVMANGRICVNVLAGAQTDLALRFGGKLPHDERFASGTWTQSDLGLPVLQDALNAFECSIDSWQDIGTHRVLFCKVDRITQSGADSGLVYFGRKFLTLAAA